MGDKELFYVIEFYDGIQIIPDNWIIEGENLAYWPKVKTNKDFDTLVRTRSSIKDDWTLEPIKAILYKTDTFLNAKVKLKKAEYQSDVDSPYNTDERKRQRRNNAKVQFTSDNESDEEQSRVKRKKNTNLKRTLPPLPQVPVAMSSKATNISNNPSCSNTSDVTEILNNSCSTLLAATHSKSDVPNNSAPFVDINKTSSYSRSKKLDISVSSSNNDKEFNHEIHQILKIVNSLKISMSGLTSLTREIIERLDVLEKNNESYLQMQSALDEYNTLVEVFPIITADSLKEVETKIKNDSAFKGKLIKDLTQVTCTDIKKTVRHILHYLITDEMAQDYSWLGQRCKAAFQNLEISKILTVVVKMRHQDATHEQISSVAAEWLKHAKQRVQRQSQKKEKCQKKPQITSSDDSENNDESN